MAFILTTTQSHAGCRSWESPAPESTEKEHLSQDSSLEQNTTVWPRRGEGESGSKAPSSSLEHSWVVSNVKSFEEWRILHLVLNKISQDKTACNLTTPAGDSPGTRTRADRRTLISASTLAARPYPPTSTRENQKVPVMEDKFLNTSPRNLDLNYPKPSSHPVSLISRADCGRKQDKLQLQGGQGHPQQASSTAAAAEKPSEGMVVKEA
ncbi:uncharacterized protein [Desmodus rotundus]|uniref:uncharacterized protein n=1 Tax=Desmodus rotundus TaxID=9430 RepID=UPI002381270A|nr:uncharacterized protein LOC123480225 [Desmodus rotundus]